MHILEKFWRFSMDMTELSSTVVSVWWLIIGRNYIDKIANKLRPIWVFLKLNIMMGVVLLDKYVIYFRV